MRKLARDLMRTDNISERIPLYINLKEWSGNRLWETDSPPTSEEFREFILQNISRDIDYNSQPFLRQEVGYAGQTIFDALNEAGYFFYILDSFDEIPAVLDQQEHSWLIEALSITIVNFIVGGRRSRGVISSWLFRRPKIVHSQRSVFEIRPFSVDRVVNAIRMGANDPETLKRIVLIERPDLGAIARNPFLLHLIIIYFNLKKETPPSQAAMFDLYINESMKLGRELYKFSSVSDHEILTFCERIAFLMFKHPRPD